MCLGIDWRALERLSPDRYVEAIRSCCCRSGWSDESRGVVLVLHDSGGERACADKIGPSPPVPGAMSVPGG